MALLGSEVRWGLFRSRGHWEHVHGGYILPWTLLYSLSLLHLPEGKQPLLQYDPATVMLCLKAQSQDLSSPELFFRGIWSHSDTKVTK